MKAYYKNRTIIDIEVDNIDHSDYPDFVDAYVSNAYWLDTGKQLIESELDELNEDSYLVHELVYMWIY